MPSPARGAEQLVPPRLHRAALWVAYRLLLGAWFVFRPRRRGAFVAVWHDGRLLAIRNSYRHWLSLPAGGVKAGEDARAAAARELGEEVGIELGPEALRFACEVPSGFEYKRDRCAFYEVTLAAPPEVRIDGREVVWAGFLRPDEVLAGDPAPPVRSYLESRAAPARGEAPARRAP